MFSSNFKNNLKKNLEFFNLLPQLVLIFILIFLIYSFIINTEINLKSRNLNFGFDFLNTNTGFDVQFSLISYDGSSSFLRVYFVGLLNTLLVAIFGIFFATILGFVIGVSRLSSNWIINKLSLVYVEIFRNVPLILQILFFYFVVIRSFPNPEKSFIILNFFIVNLQGIYIPKFLFINFSYILFALLISLIGIIILKHYANKIFYDKGKIIPVIKISLFFTSVILILFSLIGQVSFTIEFPKIVKNFGIINYVGGVKLVPEFIALLFSLSLYTSAFIAENVRAGILSINKGQKEASRSLGLNDSQTLKLIIIPQALRVIIPPTTNQYLNLTKNSSLATTIGYPDLAAVFAGTALSQTGKAIEIIFIVMMTYLTISLLISFILNLYNKKIAIIER
jgi:general L-amino acid transport system permease protein